MPLIKYLTKGAADALDYEGTKRSIVRYLQRYERDWDRTVWITQDEMVMCRPPEEGGLCMIRSRVVRAFNDLVAEGVLVRTRGGRQGRTHYRLARDTSA